MTELEQYARTVRIRIFGLPARVETLRQVAFARRRYRTAAFVVAYVRHRHTNYDNLIIFIFHHGPQHAPRSAADILCERVSALVTAELDRRYGDAWRNCRDDGKVTTEAEWEVVR